jgi:hypothetical protein
MTGRLLLLAVLLPLALGATAAQAQTYKWVDETGVITYSNKPPAASSRAAKYAQLVPDRLSVYQSDPSLQSAAASYRSSPRNSAAETEWLQRQQIMAMQWFGLGSGYYGGGADYPVAAYGGGIPMWGPGVDPFFGPQFGHLLNPPSPAALLQPQVPAAALLQARIPGTLPNVIIRPLRGVHAPPITRRAR